MRKGHTQADAADELDQLCRFVAATGFEDLDEGVRLQARLVWMDTVGVILGGSLEPQARALASRLAPRGRGRATVLAPGFPRTDPMTAALLNGTAGIFLELDEGHRPTGHPAIYTIPAILALAEDVDAGGERLIEALVLGYEVTMRIARACTLSRDIHPHSSLGTVAAATATAKLMGFDAMQVRQAISMATSLTLTGPWESAFEGALVRNLYAGMSGQVGVLCTHLVGGGFSGPRHGVASAFGTVLGRDFQPHLLTEGLGRSYHITDNYFKFHAACRHAHAPLDALAAALGGLRLSPTEVEKVTVVSHYPATRCDGREPSNTLAAKFSIPFAVATAMVRGGSGVDAFRQGAVEDSVTRSLAQRVEVTEDAHFNDRFPQEDPARVEIRTRDGRRLVGAVDHPRSDAHSRPSAQELQEKFAGLASPVLSKEGAWRAVRLFQGMERWDRASRLTATLRRWGRKAS